MEVLFQKSNANPVFDDKTPFKGSKHFFLVSSPHSLIATAELENRTPGFVLDLPSRSKPELDTSLKKKNLFLLMPATFSFETTLFIALLYSFSSVLHLFRLSCLVFLFLAPATFHIRRLDFYAGKIYG